MTWPAGHPYAPPAAASHPAALAPVDAPTVLAYIQAGGKGSRLDVLTTARAKPALPVAGEYQLIDVALSNLVNSGVRDVWVSVQYLASSLDAHLLGGRPWDLDGSWGGFRRIVPQQGSRSIGGEGFASGSADDLYGALDDLAAFGPDLVVVMSADQLMRLDLREPIVRHMALAESLDREVVTVFTVEVSEDEATHKTVLQVDADRRVVAVADKPEQPASTTISAEVMIFHSGVLREALEAVHDDLAGQAHDDGDAEAGDDEPALGDLGERVLPWLAEQEFLYAEPLPGYWLDLGRVENYLRAHRDILDGDCTLFEDPDWPMVTNVLGGAPARFIDGCEVSGSMVSRGCTISGTVRNSVLGPGVVVEPDAVVEDSVLFANVVVHRGAHVATSVLDEGVQVAEKARVGRLKPTWVDPDDITVMGAGSRIMRPGMTIEPGARVERGTDVWPEGDPARPR